MKTDKTICVYTIDRMKGGNEVPSCGYDLTEDDCEDWNFCPGCGGKIARSVKPLPKGVLSVPRRIYGPMTEMDQMFYDMQQSAIAAYDRTFCKPSPSWIRLLKPGKFPEGLGRALVDHHCQ